jgi:signal transduction histidine kinase
VAEQPDGSVWAATDRGIVALRMEGTTLAEARLLTSINRRLVSTRIRHLSVHRDTTWIGTTGGGLARVAGPEGSVQTLAALLNDPLYATIKVLDVAFDGAAVWAATHGGGVVMLRGDEPPTVFTTADGLPGAIVRDVEVDATGRVWATTDGGLACKPPDRDRFELVPLPVPGIGGVGRMAAVPDGEFFVAGTSRGLFVLNPAAVGAASRPPPVAVTGATVMGRPVRIDPGAASHARPTLHLAPTDDFVSVQFAVLDFAWPPSNQLEYRLATSDAAWQRLGASGTVSFSHLRPGTHNLDVRGRRLMGPWSASPAHVVLEVVPSFWETRWFRAALIMVLLGGVAGGLVLRRRARRRTERLRRRIADDLHDDLGSKISSVTLMLDLVRRDAGPDHASMLKEASATARDVARDLRDAIWIVDASYDTLAAFLNHVRTVASRLSPQQFVHVTIPEEAHAVDLTMEQRRHLLLFVKEAMHNAARHAKATTITVSTRMASGTVTLAVHDDGRGFSRDAITPGRGLQTLQRRADALAGTLTLETDVGEGTTVALSFPTR